jgi:hypothetical protein
VSDLHHAVKVTAPRSAAGGSSSSADRGTSPVVAPAREVDISEGSTRARRTWLVAGAGLALAALVGDLVWAVGALEMFLLPDSAAKTEWLGDLASPSAVHLAEWSGLLPLVLPAWAMAYVILRAGPARVSVSPSGLAFAFRDGKIAWSSRWADLTSPVRIVTFERAELRPTPATLVAPPERRPVIVISAFRTYGLTNEAVQAIVKIAVDASLPCSRVVDPPWEQKDGWLRVLLNVGGPPSRSAPTPIRPAAP